MVPGHSKVPGNTKAHKLAQLATSPLTRVPYTHFQKSDSTSLYSQTTGAPESHSSGPQTGIHEVKSRKVY